MRLTFICDRWLQAPSPGMSFNQVQSIPAELKLRTTPDGVRLVRSPIDELKTLRDGDNQSQAIQEFSAQEFELRLGLRPEQTKSLSISLAGLAMSYDAERQTLRLGGHTFRVSLVHGEFQITAYVDRTVIEIFAADGQVYATMPWIAPHGEAPVQIDSQNHPSLDVELYRLGTAWPVR